MWVVVIGIAPLLWLLLETNVGQKSKEEQDKFWLIFLIVFLTVGFVFIVLNSATNSTAVVIMLPVAIVAPIIILKTWFKLSDLVHNKCVQNKSGAFGELKTWIWIDIMLFVGIIIMACAFG